MSQTAGQKYGLLALPPSFEIPLFAVSNIPIQGLNLVGMREEGKEMLFAKRKTHVDQFSTGACPDSVPTHRTEFSVRHSPVLTSHALKITASGWSSAIISVNLACWAVL